jgi:hypothetical protein
MEEIKADTSRSRDHILDKELAANPELVMPNRFEGLSHQFLLNNILFKPHAYQVLVGESLRSPSPRSRRDAQQRDFGAVVLPHTNRDSHKRPTMLLSFVPNIPSHYFATT